jgi:hypothetical protein
LYERARLEFRMFPKLGVEVCRFIYENPLD